MKNYFVFFDFFETPDNFLKFFEAHQFSWKCTDRVWYLKSKHSAKHIFDELSKGLNEKDKLIVTEVDKPIHRQGFNEDCDLWFDYKY